MFSCGVWNPLHLSRVREGRCVNANRVSLEVSKKVFLTTYVGGGFERVHDVVYVPVRVTGEETLSFNALRYAVFNNDGIVSVGSRGLVVCDV